MLEAIMRNHSRPLEPLPTGVPPHPARFAAVKAVLFDVYGTLFISGSGDVGTAAAANSDGALAQSLAAAGFAGRLEEAGRAGRELLQAGIQAAHAAARASGILHPEVEICAIWQKVLGALRRDGTLAGDEPALDQVRRLALEYECRVNPVHPMPGAMETIGELERRGLVLGIVSNAQFYTPLLFPAFFGKTLDQCGFDADCCAWSYREREAKPSAALFEKALRALAGKHGVAPQETIFVGNDLLNDIHGARQAGCRTVLFAGDQRSLRLRDGDPRCDGTKPDAVATALPQLPAMLPW